MKTIKCGHISDTHQENIADIVVTDLKTESFGTLDLLFISGDLTYRGDIDKLKRCADQCEDLVKYGYVKDIVVTPGNHDKTFHKAKMINDKPSNWETPERARECFNNKPGIHLLIHQAIELHGIKIFGSPWTPEFCNWAYNYYWYEAKVIWDKIPQNTQILMTHGPPEFILDEVREYMKIKYCGCPELARKIVTTPSIQFHLFGHIHEGHGKVEKNGVTYLNSSIMDGNYKPTNRPQYFEFKPKAI